MRVFTFLWLRLCVLLIVPMTWIQAQNGSIFTQEQVVITLPDCQGGGHVCLEEIPPAEMQNFAFILDGNPVTGPFPVCKQDTLSIYSYEFLFGKGNSGPYRLDSWFVNGQLFHGQFQTIPDLVDSMNVWDPNGNWTHIPAAFQIRGGQSSSAYTKMVLTVLSINTPSVIGYNVSYTTKALGISVEKGIHQLIALNQQTGDLDTLAVIAGCMSFTQQHIETEIGWTDTGCMDLSALTGAVALIQNQCTVPDYPSSMAEWDDTTGCISWMGTTIGMDTLCLIACDEYGFCTSTTYIIDVHYPGALSAIPVAVLEGDTLLFCPDLSGLPGNPVSIDNLCEDGSGIHASVSIQNGQFCVQIIGQSFGGPEYACFAVCDDQGICDTITVEILVLFRNEDVINLQTGLFFDEEYCPDISLFSGSMLSLSNVCPDQSGMTTTIQIDPVTHCIEYTGIQPGTDTVCLLIEDEYGNQSLTMMIIQVVPPEIAFDTLAIDVGMELTYCPDFSELSGTMLTTTSYCPLAPDGPVSMVIDPLTSCVVLNGANEGVAQICLVVCNEFGVCDTVLVHVVVTMPVKDPLPKAVNDVVESFMNQPVNIPVLLNDKWGSTPVSVELVTAMGPANGTLLVEVNGSLTYQPNSQFCGSDQFAYQLCNQTGCDTALVIMTIRCDQPALLTPYTGFSPNGDGINEYFTVDGLDAFPRNTLEVYNRWGNRIFIKTDYQGDWDGTWGGLVLPDGTYFYLLKPEGHPELSGYVHLHR